MTAVAAAQSSAPVYARCRPCGVLLGPNEDRTHGVCADCVKRPEGKRILAGQPKVAPARAFSIAEKSLIKNMHHILPPADLLRILNDRLQADVGAGVPLWTLEQLHEETSTLQQSERASDWAGLREILRMARQCGVLARVTPQMIDDFAVAFQLSSAQVMNLRDVIRGAKEGQ